MRREKGGERRDEGNRSSHLGLGVGGRKKGGGEREESGGEERREKEEEKR